MRTYEKVASTSSSDGNTQYLILGLCTGVILIISGVISFIVIRTIKDKCCIFHIFSTIPFEDAKKMATLHKNFNVKDVTLDKEQIVNGAETIWKTFTMSKEGFEEPEKKVEELNDSLVNPSLDGAGASLPYKNKAFFSAIEYQFVVIA
eukprot:TRINITY_DN22583_c0_g1_i2.p1 TRINITY_DN22583_c0_g1~~TRINITY_DN22583_c0_g1_i2.p1  ORF type:complete len:148 (-),score=46.25 TRINITY_DN22583_c0_g1_i2:389-832(-)